MIPIATLRKFLQGTIDLENDTIKVALLKESTEYTPDAINHNFVSDVLDGGTTGAEFDDSNYTRKTLGTPTTSVDSVDNEAVFDGDDLSWTDLGSATGGQTIEAVLVYRQVGGDDTTPGDDEIICIRDDSEEADLPKTTNGETFNWNWDSEGIINLTP